MRARGKPGPKKAQPKKKGGRGGARANSGGKRKGAGRKPAPRKVEDYAKLGLPPTDPLELLVWTQRALAVGMYHVMTDKRLTEDARQAKIRSYSGRINALTPRSRIRQAEKTIEGATKTQKARVAPKEQEVEEMPMPTRPGVGAAK